MGVTLYPVEDGDEDKYEIFDITSDQPWVPRSFQTKSMACNVTTPPTSKTLICNIPNVSDSLTYFDPKDGEVESLGNNIQLQIAPFVEALTYHQVTGSAGGVCPLSPPPCDESHLLHTEAF